MSAVFSSRIRGFGVNVCRRVVSTSGFQAQGRWDFLLEETYASALGPRDQEDFFTGLSKSFAGDFGHGNGAGCCACHPWGKRPVSSALSAHGAESLRPWLTQQPSCPRPLEQHLCAGRLPLSLASTVLPAQYNPGATPQRRGLGAHCRGVGERGGLGS